MSRRGSHPSYANQIGERCAQLRQAGMDTPCLEFPVNGRVPIVCQCVLQTSSPKCSDGQTAYSLGREQTTTIPSHHLKVSCSCVRGDPARGTFLVSSQIHPCDRIDVDDSTLLPCVSSWCVFSQCAQGVCLSLDACEVRLPKERHMFRNFVSHIWIYDIQSVT